MQSHSVSIRPQDDRCRFWAKLVRADQSLPAPSSVLGANDVPGPYSLRGVDELMPGDALLEGEAVHHKRTDRGWVYRLRVVAEDGALLVFRSGFGEQRKQLKEAGMDPLLLQGAGDVAAMVRIVHGVRSGLLVQKAEAEA